MFVSVAQSEVGAPGVVVGVSVDGAEVWSEGGFLFNLHDLFVEIFYCSPPVLK